MVQVAQLVQQSQGALSPCLLEVMDTLFSSPLAWPELGPDDRDNSNILNQPISYQ